MTLEHYERVTGSHRSIVETLSMPASRASSWTSPVHVNAPHGSDTRRTADEEAVGFPLDDKTHVKFERAQQRRLAVFPNGEVFKK
jgi:hypothetical protein